MSGDTGRTPDHSPTTRTRRGCGCRERRSAGLLAQAACAGGGTDPVIALHGQYLAADAALNEIGDRHNALMRGLLERRGYPGDGFKAWEQDPDWPAFVQLDDQLDPNGEELGRLTEEIMLTPAMTVAGVVAKLKLCLSLFPEQSDRDDWHEDQARLCLADAIRLLEVR